VVSDTGQPIVAAARGDRLIMQIHGSTVSIRESAFGAGGRMVFVIEITTVSMAAADIEVTASHQEAMMSGLIRKSLDTPDETRLFEGGKGQLEVVNADGGAVGRATFLPGWKWSEHVKPIAKTDSCQAAHTGYFVSGRMKVVMDDGEEMEYGPGDFAVMAPGHDAWIIGDEPCVVIDWQGYADYAKR